MPSRLEDPARCPRCAFRAPCLCPEIPRIETRVEVQILRHAAESAKPSGSARWAALALPSCLIVDYARDAAPFDPAALDLRDAWLVFPGSGETPRGPPPARLIVPDGTWQQARRMVARLPALRSLPRLVLAAPTARVRLRVPHLPEGMSTLEAVAAALGALGEEVAAERLRHLYAAAVRRTESFGGSIAARRG